ncbi:HAD-IC family P-type ATPase [Companilactobacillus allii]|uniref:Magnesium-transporting ATPase n=1 Tax=Companilactobacillus allii TaxID=1847728 RepID=A0A1P8PZS6_9LACO|nr:HAD-IC family P-type ATPase [Companilactobacillus allii]APX71124.1 magnesium-transporting ATPase [Companilactobacillus allii]USQ68203.1 HAD-IC family P-type ATPase [Companilactobacillus allii]
MKKKFFQMGLSELQEQNNIEDFKQGLTDEDAGQRLIKDGPNKLEAHKTSKWKIFFRQFKSMIIYVLIASTLITLLMGHYSDSVIIGLVVIINALIGYYQETNASDALEKIKNMLSTNATVYREGQRKDVPATELVVGDLVFLEAGDNVPADLRIVDSDNLRIQESALTGEANSVEKTVDAIEEEAVSLADQTNMAFASTSVTNGSGTGLVVATGSDTEIGKISTSVSSVKERKTPLMQIIDKLGTNTSYFIVAASIAIFIIGLIFDTYSVSVLALAVVAMMVGAIPEGLPATTSVILAKGVSDMAKNQNTIVKTLPAVETLGSVDVVATDKTGTLTQNEMTVTDIMIGNTEYQVSGTGYRPDGQITKNGQPVEIDDKLELFLEAGFEANDTELTKENGQWIINGEPTDGAFLTLYHKVHPYGNEPKYEELDILPFDSEFRYMAKLVKDKDDNRTLFVKGSPDKLLEMAKKNDPKFDFDMWFERVKRFSEDGKRVIAVGYENEKKTTNEITHDIITDGINFLGLVAIIDPPREEVIEALKVMNTAGVDVKMITGDNAIIAKSIGKQLGLADEIHAITGLEWDKLTDEEKVEAANENQVFARTTPSNKIEIIEALQKSNKVTAMTGDGVNDAPALKRADIGVAMGIKGTDVAKDSADMILTDDNFATISTAIREGRRIFDNIKKSILYLLPISFSEGLIVAYAILTKNDIPLHPTQLLWINMVSAITIQFALIFEPAEDGIMNRAPRKTGAKFMNRHDIFQMAYVAMLIAGVSLVIDAWMIQSGFSTVIASTTMVNVLVVGKIFYLFNIRTPKLALSKELFSNIYVFIFVGLMLILQLILTYVPFMQDIFHTGPIGLKEWGLAVIGGIIVLSVAELDKIIRILHNKKKA